MAIVAFVFALCIGFLAEWEGRTNERRRWREWMCTRDSTTLIDDAYCIRADTSYWVPEPPSKP
jgi:hypothetical protein